MHLYTGQHFTLRSPHVNLNFKAANKTGATYKYLTAGGSNENAHLTCNPCNNYKLLIREAVIL